MTVQTSPPRRLYRSRENRIIAGVAGGIAEYLRIDPTVVRLLWILISLIFPPALLLDVVVYVVLWIVIPVRPVAQ